MEGKLDFHGLRTSYINMLIDSGADVKTVQEMSRHDTVAVTFDIYGRTKRERMVKVADKVGDIVAGSSAHTAPTQVNDTA